MKEEKEPKQQSVPKVYLLSSCADTYTEELRNLNKALANHEIPPCIHIEVAGKDTTLVSSLGILDEIPKCQQGEDMHRNYFERLIAVGPENHPAFSSPDIVMAIKGFVAEQTGAWAGFKYMTLDSLMAEHAITLRDSVILRKK